MSPPPLSVAYFVNFAFNFLLMLLKRSLTARALTANCGKLFNLFATSCQQLPLSLLPGLLSNTPSPATSFSIIKSFSSDHTITDLVRHKNTNCSYSKEREKEREREEKLENCFLNGPHVVLLF